MGDPHQVFNLLHISPSILFPPLTILLCAYSRTGSSRENCIAHVNKAAFEHEKAEKAKKKAMKAAKALAKAFEVELDEDDDDGDDDVSASGRHPFFSAWLFIGPMSERNDPIFQVSQGPGAQNRVPQPKGTSRLVQREREHIQRAQSVSLVSPDAQHVGNSSLAPVTPSGSNESGSDLEYRLLIASEASASAQQANVLLKKEARDKAACEYLMENGSTEEIRQHAKRKLESMMLAFLM